MMNGMGGLEDGGPVHPAMRPVEPGVVRDQIEQHRNRPVPERPGVDVGVDLRPAAILPAPGDDPGRHAVDRGGGEAPPDFPPDLRVEPGIEVRMPRLGRQRECPRGEQIADTDDQRHGDGGQDQGKRHGGLVPYRGRGLNRERPVRGLLFARRRREVPAGVSVRGSLTPADAAPSRRERAFRPGASIHVSPRPLPPIGRMKQRVFYSSPARGGGVRALVCPRQTKIVPGAQSRSNTKLVEGCRALDGGAPLRQGFALPPPLAGEEYTESV